MSLKFFSVALVATTCALPQFEVQMKGSAEDPCEPCLPNGTGTTPRAVGTDLSSLYNNVLASVKDIHFLKQEVAARDSGFCCPKHLNCVNVQNLNIAMCYDKFTTNFGFGDGSHGSLTSGGYSSGSNNVNLFTGNYTAGGQQGNIYASNAANKPNTATLSKPPQFTGTGIGGPIPANQLGSVIVITTTMTGQTYTRPTMVPQSVQVSTVNGRIVSSTTISAKIISQATTVAPITSVETLTQQVASSTPAKSKGTAAQVGVDGTKGVGMSIFCVLLCVLV